MSGFTIRRKLTKDQAEKAIAGITKWFEEHPRRRVCYTTDDDDVRWFPVRRKHIRADVMLHTVQ